MCVSKTRPLAESSFLALLTITVQLDKSDNAIAGEADMSVRQLAAALLLAVIFMGGSEI